MFGSQFGTFLIRLGHTPLSLAQQRTEGLNLRLELGQISRVAPSCCLLIDETRPVREGVAQLALELRNLVVAGGRDHLEVGQLGLRPPELRVEGRRVRLELGQPSRLASLLEVVQPPLERIHLLGRSQLVTHLLEPVERVTLRVPQLEPRAPAVSEATVEDSAHRLAPKELDALLLFYGRLHRVHLHRRA